MIYALLGYLLQFPASFLFGRLYHICRVYYDRLRAQFCLSIPRV